MSVPEPVLVKVEIREALLLCTSVAAKARVVGESTAEAAVTPVPDRVISKFPATTLSATVTVAFRAPSAVGVNVALTAQLAPTAKLAGDSGQVLVVAKSPGLVPPKVILVMISGPVPVLVITLVRSALPCPWAWLPKLRAAGTAETVGANPVPLSGTV